MNYTKDQTEYMIEKYKTNPSRDTVEELADEFSKSIKSVIGKLSREGVYRREVYKTKTGESPITKLEIVESIADALGLESESLVGLEKAQKATLKTIEKVLSE
jgi:DNA-binding XRE family transcriptional regulator